MAEILVFVKEGSTNVFPGRTVPLGIMVLLAKRRLPALPLTENGSATVIRMG